MSTAIELPGEAAPLNPQQIYLALQSAGSQQQNLIRSGTQQLENWERQKGYFYLLQEVYLDRSLPTEIRYLAVIQLKRGVDRCWRKSATHAIDAEEKKRIRPRLLEGGITEADPQLALQHALMVAKIIRVDYPQEWPDALKSLIELLRSAKDSNQLHLRRGLMMLLQITKELATARLRRSQILLQGLTPEIVMLLGDIYTENVKFWMNFLDGNGDDEGGAMDAMEISLLTLKILRRLLVSGYDRPHLSKEVQHFWIHSQDHFGQFLSMVTQEPPVVVPPAKDVVEKHLVQLAKLHSQMANGHPAAFALLPHSVELTRAYWRLIAKFGDSYGSAIPDFTAEGSSPDNDMKNRVAFMEKLSLKGLLILRFCVKMVFSPTKTFKYQSAEVKEEQAQAAVLIKTELLTDSLVSEVAEVIVTKFFVFRQEDLRAWEEEPDEWEIKEDGGGDAWEFEVRPCAEKLFMDLVLNFKQLLKQPLLGFFQSVGNTSDTALLTKNSVYTAMGLCAPAIHEDFDFDAFLMSTLVNDVQQSGPNYKILRRRIAILIGKWVTVNISDSNRALVYQIFQHLLNPQDQTNDLVVRVTAAKQLYFVVEDFGFKPEQFLPFAPNILGHLIGLIQEVDNTETKLPVLESVRVICVRLEQHISTFADPIVSILPHLWEGSGDEHLLKQAILALLSTLVTAMKGQAQRYNSLIIPLIQQAVLPQSDSNVYLMEESLELWLAVLMYTPTPAPSEIILLAESAFPLLELGSEHLRMVLTIIDSYILLSPGEMLGDGVRLRTLSYMASLIGSNRRDLAGAVTTIVERMILCAETLGGTEGVAVVTKDLFETGYTERIMDGLRDAWETHENVGPEKRHVKLDISIRTDYFTVLARIALADPITFTKLLSSVGDFSSTWAWLSKEWFSNLDSMTNIDRQKLSCLALTRLLELPQPYTPHILQKLQDYFSMWTTVVTEMQEGRDEGDVGDNLVWSAGAGAGNEFESPEDIRKRLQSVVDPVHTVHTLQFVMECMRKVVQNCGGEEAFQREWADNVDRDVIQSFQVLASASAAAAAGNNSGASST